MTVEDAIAAVVGLRLPGDAALSHDGSRLAYSVTEVDGDRTRTSVYLAASTGETVATAEGALPRLSPDGSSLAFVADDSAVRVLAAGGARDVADPGGAVEDLRWSADGAWLLALLADPGSDRAGVDGATRVPHGDGPYVHRPGLRRRRLIRVGLDGTTEEVGPPENVWEIGWDGSGPVAAVVSADAGENAWYDARLALLDLAGGMDVVYEPAKQVASPALLPDGRLLAFVEGLASDRATLAGEVTVLDLSSGERATPVPGIDATLVAWAGERLFYAGHRGFGSECGFAGGETWPAELSLGGRRIAAAGSADGETMAAVVDGPRISPDVAVRRGGTVRRVTRLNDVAPFAEPECLAWQAADGTEIEGLLYPGEGLRLAVVVHGGPAAAWAQAFAPGGSPLVPALVAAGYTVLLPNPRGSVGRGQAFTRANVGDLGGADLRDIEAGIDAVAARGLADPARAGIVGGSYGGFLAAWAAVASDRFAAAVAAACISDWRSYNLTSNIGRFDELFLGTDAALRDARSPALHAAGTRTPTLVAHGALDRCTPIGQAYELHFALRAAGCETELVVYDDEGHGFRRPPNRVDYVRRVVDWFDRYL